MAVVTPAVFYRLLSSPALRSSTGVTLRCRVVCNADAQPGNSKKLANMKLVELRALCKA